MKFKGISSQPRKKRKALAMLPLHGRQKLVGVHLSRELRKQLKKRAMPARKGDKVLVLSGKFKKKSGKIVRVELKDSRIFAEGIFLKKQGGKELLAPLNPSNLLLLEVVERKHRARKAGAAKVQAERKSAIVPRVPVQEAAREKKVERGGKIEARAEA